MGSGASGFQEQLGKASPEEVSNVLKEMPPESIAKIKAALDASKPQLFDFKSGLPDCCTSNPNNYKVLAELAGARLILMTLGPGEEDKPHDHPPHPMYVLQGGKLAITGYTDEGKPAGDPHEVELPTGAPPVMPAGAHQVKNVGDTEVKVIFVEPTLLCVPCAPQPDFKSPLDACPECYKKLGENDGWFTGEMTLGVGKEDKPHSHREHLLYVLEGDALCIYPGKEKDASKKMDMKIEPGAALGVPSGDHIVENTGTKDIKIVFFEMKQ